jgi:spectinomycin phosphotransferase
MKDKPDLQDETIVDQLQEAYGVRIAQVEFLPIGDISSAKYRVVTDEPLVYFLKLRTGAFKEISVFVPHFLHEQGIHQVISPLKTRDGRLWTYLDAYTCIMYPFIEGQNGFQHPLSASQWIELGVALKSVHATHLPPDLHRLIPCEAYSPHWRELVKGFLFQAGNNAYQDPVAADMAASLQAHREDICYVIERAAQLGEILQSQPLEQLLCHADIHAGNLLLEANGALHIIDWDDPVLAPKERDLMFIGGGIGGIWNTPSEEALFYQGYGEKDINRPALTYYRYERIVSDIAEFSQQILLTTEGGADRERSLQKFHSIF